jgi:DNA mismatch repair protein MutS
MRTEFFSILFTPRWQVKVLNEKMPDFFPDLHLDQVIETITSKKTEYNLKPFFYTFPIDLETIRYRQQVMKDLENPALFKQVELFVQGMQSVRKQLIQVEKINYPYHKERMFLDVVILYCETVSAFANALMRLSLNAEGLIAFSRYLTDYIQSTYFTTLFAEAKSIIQELLSIKYNLYIKDLRIHVLPSQSEADYTLEVLNTFAKFQQGKVKDYKNVFTRSPQISHVEAKILEGLATLNPHIFNRLIDYYAKNSQFQDRTITTFEHEIQFYLSYLEFIDHIKRSGLQFCYPLLSDTKEIEVKEGFDIALAHKGVEEKTTIVTNDFCLKGNERLLVVTGPNQGGKTTFARMFGQMHYLAGIGCPVPGVKAQLFLCNHIFTHFEKKEDIQNLRSKLEDDLVRLHRILQQCSSGDIVILNEILTSATLHDSIFLSKKIMEKIIDLDVIGVWVTFIDELASYSEKTVSMAATIFPENPSLRTYKIVRMPANGLAYALSIAEKYQLTYSMLKKRIGTKV